MNKISIIVPVYNTAPFLGACIQSICEQTYADFELLLIDDGSTDDSHQICTAYASSDLRIRVFRQQNAGVSAARNLALEKATGAQVCFIDSDDWVEPDYLMQFVARQEQGPALILQNFLIDTTTACTPVSYTPESRIEKGEFTAAFHRLDLLCKTGACTKLYDMRIIREQGLRFKPEIHYGEDCLFMLEYLRYVDLLIYTDYAGYHYMHREGVSLSKRYNSFDSEHAAFESLRTALHLLAGDFKADEQSMNYMNEWLALFFLRVIQSFYRNKADLDLKTRVDLKRNVYTPETRLILKQLSGFATPMPLLLSALLYRRGYFYLHDLYMRLFVRIREMR